MLQSENGVVATLRLWRWRRGQPMAAASWQPPHGCIAAAHTAHAQGAACAWSARQACEVGALQGCGAQRGRSIHSRFSHRPPAARAGNRSPSSAAPPARRSKHVDVSCCCRGASARMSLSAQPAEAAERRDRPRSMLPAGLPCCGGSAGVRQRRRPTSSRSSTNEMVRSPGLNPATARHGHPPMHTHTAQCAVL